MTTSMTPLKKLTNKKQRNTEQTRITLNWFSRIEFEIYRAEKNKVLLNHPLKKESDNDSLLSRCREELGTLLENSQTQKQFIMGAKKIWLKVSIARRKANLRRPSEWKTTIVEVQNWYKKNERDHVYETALDAQLIRYVKAKHPRLDKSTIRKYVRLFRLTWTPPWKRTNGDWKFLEKNAPGLAKDELEIIRHILRDREENDWLSSLLRQTEQRIPSSVKSL